MVDFPCAIEGRQPRPHLGIVVEIPQNTHCSLFAATLGGFFKMYSCCLKLKGACVKFLRRLLEISGKLFVGSI